MNRHTNLFFETLLKCPLEYRGIIKLFTIVDTHKKSYPLIEENRFKDCFFKGFVFRDNKVLVFNITIFNKEKNYKSEYLDITDVFNKYLDKYNIVLLCMVINKNIHTYCRESSIAENLIYNLQNADANKIQSLIDKQKNREKPFIRDNSDMNKNAWFNRIERIIKAEESKLLLKSKELYKTAFKLI